MGTNYYVNTNFCKECERCDKIHIGKSSAGWKFAVEINRIYYKNYKEFIEFLRNNDGNIYDEYGESISFDKLMDEIESKKDDKPHNALKSKQEGEVDLIEQGFS